MFTSIFYQDESMCVSSILDLQVYTSSKLDFMCRRPLVQCKRQSELLLKCLPHNSFKLKIWWSATLQTHFQSRRKKWRRKNHRRHLLWPLLTKDEEVACSGHKMDLSSSFPSIRLQWDKSSNPCLHWLQWDTIRVLFSFPGSSIVLWIRLLDGAHGSRPIFADTQTMAAQSCLPWTRRVFFWVVWVKLNQNMEEVLP